MLDDERNINLYTSLLEKHGCDYQALNWGSKESQLLRFQVLADIGVSEGDSILDVGCGLGDFYEWLDKNLPSLAYAGLDMTPAMVKAAAKRFPSVSFIEGTIDALIEQRQQFDFVMASGIFAHRQQSPIDFLHNMIEKMYEQSIKGCAFNCLSSWRDIKDEQEFYANPLSTVEFCRSLSSRVVLRHDYHEGDFTIYMYRPEHQNIKVLDR